MKSKNFVYYALSPLPLFLILAFLLYLYDPMQFWHKPLWRDATFSGDARVQNKGIIDNYDFDSIILGTSMLQQTPKEYANDKLGGTWENLSMSDGTFNQRAIILQYALKNKEIKRVIYSLDPDYFNKFSESSSFAYLYKSSNLDIMKFYFNWRFIFCALKWSESAHCVGNKRAKYDFKEIDSKHKEFPKWAKNEMQNIKGNATLARQWRDFRLDSKEKPKINTNVIDKYVLDIVKATPDTQFYFLIPTYSRLAYYANGVEYFANFRAYILYFISQIRNLPNATLIGFDDENYADNPANYWERTHYYIDLNLMQIDSIANKTHILDSKNIESYLATMLEKIKNYDSFE